MRASRSSLARAGGLASASLALAAALSACDAPPGAPAKAAASATSTAAPPAQNASAAPTSSAALTSSAAAEPVDPTVTKARAAVGAFKVALKKELVAALAKSPVHAIEVCEKRAPELAREHGGEGLVLGRSSKGLRNPNNAPKPWLAAVLDELEKVESGSAVHRVVPLEGDRVAYVEPLWTGQECLLCHGESVAPDVVAALASRYPRDAARGFKQGQLRGVVYAELAKVPPR